MNKKFLALLMVLVVLSSAVFAGPILQIGPSVTYERVAGDVFKTGLKDSKLNDFGIGGDLRINLPFSQIAIFADCGMPFGKDVKALSISGGVSANVRIDLQVVDFFAGAGVQLKAYNNFETKTWTFNGVPFTNFGDFMKTCSLFYRGGTTINIGFIGLSIFADVPTVGTFAKFEGATFTPKWDETKFSASLLFNI